MMGIERFQNIRTRLHIFDKAEPVRINRYDSVMPRPSPALFRWHLNYHHEDRIHSPVAAPLSGPGSGALYRPRTPPWLAERTPPRAVFRDGRWEYLCRFAHPETGCARSFTNPFEEQKHIQSDHLSPNDDPAMVRGSTFFPSSWYAMGRVTDVGGWPEKFKPGSPYRQMVRARPASRSYARSLARRLA